MYVNSRLLRTVVMKVVFYCLKQFMFKNFILVLTPFVNHRKKSNNNRVKI